MEYTLLVYSIFFYFSNSILVIFMLVVHNVPDDLLFPPLKINPKYTALYGKSKVISFSPLIRSIDGKYSLPAVPVLDDEL